MKDAITVSTTVGTQTITLEAGLLAQQAAGACTIRLGDTVLFSAVTNTDKPREGIDYFPLQVEYREKFYAAGRFPGGFFKRESRPSEGEILTMRLTDRPIRPLFPENYFNEVQINNMLLGHPEHHRLERGAGHFRDPVHGPDRRRARRSCQRRVHPQPHP